MIASAPSPTFVSPRMRGGFLFFFLLVFSALCHFSAALPAIHVEGCIVLVPLNHWYNAVASIPRSLASSHPVRPCSAKNTITPRAALALCSGGLYAGCSPAYGTVDALRRMYDDEDDDDEDDDDDDDDDDDVDDDDDDTDVEEDDDDEDNEGGGQAEGEMLTREDWRVGRCSARFFVLPPFVARSPFADAREDTRRVVVSSASGCGTDRLDRRREGVAPCGCCVARTGRNRRVIPSTGSSR